MKRFYYILAIASALFFTATSIQAQEETGNTQQRARRSPQATRGERANDKERHRYTRTDRAGTGYEQSV